jgi:hypothetical protein
MTADKRNGNKPTSSKQHTCADPFCPLIDIAYETEFRRWVVVCGHVRTPIAPDLFHFPNQGDDVSAFILAQTGCKAVVRRHF